MVEIKGDIQSILQLKDKRIGIQVNIRENEWEALDIKKPVKVSQE